MPPLHVFQGLWCRCGAPHRQLGKYYVSVIEGDGPNARWKCVLGPFREHHEALAMVPAVKREVLARWNPGGAAHWYLYGTVVLAPYTTTLGILNHIFGLPGPGS
jgi:hypothetical protein